MCYYSGIKKGTVETITQIMDLDPGVYEFPLYDQISAMASPIFPVLTMEAPTKLQPLHWLFTPPWFKTMDQLKTRKIWAANVRLEEAEQKKLYRPRIERGRCAAVFSHFWEWRHEGKEKIKYRIALPEDQPLLLPGLYSRTELDGGIWQSFGVCTMEARNVMRYIHNSALRQPVVIGPESARFWLDGNVPFNEARLALMEREKSSDFVTDPETSFGKPIELFGDQS